MHACCVCAFAQAPDLVSEGGLVVRPAFCFRSTASFWVHDHHMWSGVPGGCSSVPFERFVRAVVAASWEAPVLFSAAVVDLSHDAD